jgi:hypothetical protein
LNVFVINSILLTFIYLGLLIIKSFNFFSLTLNLDQTLEDEIHYTIISNNLFKPGERVVRPIIY